jgi:hypothetical protein
MDRCQVRSISEQRRKKVWLMSESQRVSDCASAVLDARMCRRRSPHGRTEWFALVQAQTTPKSAVASWPVRTRAGVCACNGCAMNLTSRFRCGTGSGTTSIAPVPHAPHLCNSRLSKREERTAKHIFFCSLAISARTFACHALAQPTALLSARHESLRSRISVQSPCVQRPRHTLVGRQCRGPSAHGQSGIAIQVNGTNGARRHVSALGP